MVTDAPHQSGQRFVSIAVILAQQHRKLVDLARKWLEHFLLELLKMSTESDRCPDEPSIGWQVRLRDGTKCPISGCIHLEKRVDENGEEIRRELKDELRVEYFIPPPPSNLTGNLKFAYSMLWVWANLNEDDWKKRVHLPENAFLLASRHIIDHRWMDLVLEAQGTPDTYTARFAGGGGFSPTGDRSREVVFRSLEKPSSARSPDFRLVRARSALAKLIRKSGARNVRISIIRTLQNAIKARLDPSRASDSSDSELDDSD
ncbi:hypothetical protein D9613_002390 [Agrocybe pediades]|uniref:Uncharacterized protein n=1 Tax=Agrocybe pediades TaxID=84607 RepID=A0A8H4VUN4_9AGAR|nr:hypothetical protein D9613_002390 [Agrocybe pediades]